MTAAVVQMRKTPKQKRGHARLEQLLDASRKALVLHGRDRFTTAHVAELAGCSIGTVYSYFPDRFAILEAIFPEREKSLPEWAAFVVVELEESAA